MRADVLTQIRANQRHDVRLERWVRVFVEKTLPLYVMYYLRGLKEELVVLERKTKNAKVRKAWGSVWSKAKEPDEEDDRDKLWLLALLASLSPSVRAAIERMAMNSARSIVATLTALIAGLLDTFRSAVMGGAARNVALRTLESSVRQAIPGDRHVWVGEDESSRVWHAGRQEAMEQVNGTLTPDEMSRYQVVKVWYTAKDEFVCKKICAPLHEKEVLPHEPFYVYEKPGPYQVVMTAPAHNRCRCRVDSLVLIWPISNPQRRFAGAGT